jgi:hypothetical protein
LPLQSKTWHCCSPSTQSSQDWLLGQEQATSVDEITIPLQSTVVQVCCPSAPHPVQLIVSGQVAESQEG